MDVIKNRIFCDKNCMTKICFNPSENFCKWEINDELINLAKDKNYKMCEYLRSEILKMIN